MSDLDRDAIKAQAEAQARAYKRMSDLDGGVGLLGVREPAMFDDMLAWDDATDNEHADIVLALLAALEGAEKKRDDERELTNSWEALANRERERAEFAEQARDMHYHRAQFHQDSAGRDRKRANSAERERDTLRARTRGVVSDYEAQYRRADEAEARAESAERRLAAVEAAWFGPCRFDLEADGPLVSAALHPVSDTTEKGDDQ